MLGREVSPREKPKPPTSQTSKGRSPATKPDRLAGYRRIGACSLRPDPIRFGSGPARRGPCAAEQPRRRGAEDSGFHVSTSPTISGNCFTVRRARGGGGGHVEPEDRDLRAQHRDPGSAGHRSDAATVDGISGRTLAFSGSARAHAGGMDDDRARLPERGRTGRATRRDRRRGDEVAAGRGRDAPRPCTYNPDDASS